jgi:hypothetical protein
MRRTSWLVALLLAQSLCSRGFGWDGRIETEATHQSDAADVVIGCVERYPPLFYRMRLERVTREVERQPQLLELYDTTGEACARLGQYDDAIGWMKKKRRVLAALDPDPFRMQDHWRCYHVNLAKFLIRRWIDAGAERSRMDDVQAAIENIRALPGASAYAWSEPHLLRILEWIQAPPSLGWSKRIPNFFTWDAEDPGNPPVYFIDASWAAYNLANLAIEDDAWENIDLLSTLSVALQRDTSSLTRNSDHDPDEGMNTLATFAWLRARELVAAGKRSMHPRAPRGEALMAMLDQPNLPHKDAQLAAKFRELRAAADAWVAARAAYLRDRLQAGDHPDTNASFWNGYTGPEKPVIPDIEIHSRQPPGKPHIPRPGEEESNYFGSLVCGVALILILSVVIVRLRLQRNARLRARRASVSQALQSQDRSYSKALQ